MVYKALIPKVVLQRIYKWWWLFARVGKQVQECQSILTLSILSSKRLGQNLSNHKLSKRFGMKGIGHKIWLYKDICTEFVSNSMDIHQMNKSRSCQNLFNIDCFFRRNFWQKPSISKFILSWFFSKFSSLAKICYWKNIANKVLDV